jgi:hypothetical protein
MKDEHINVMDRMFPFGPICTFNGIEVPSQLITNMLSKMDDMELFDRSEGVNPFLLCNGHGSLFEEPFLEYTSESNRP